MAKLLSNEYNTLIRNTKQLGKQLLGFSKRIDGNYTDRQLTCCRAFIAFSHAEIEHYIEERALVILERAKRKWQNERSCRFVIPALLAYKKGKETPIPQNPIEQSNSTKLDSLIVEVIQRHKGIISGNNGIKEDSISNIYLPLGMDPENIENSLIVNLNAFGSRRGDLVHKNSGTSIPHLRDPFDDELKDLNYLTEDLRIFDRFTELLE